ncbi:sarcosine oxidase [Neomicrococcus aestuarii]|uniref:Sarcosine oxidase n=1 Tax=Neomicrococcus aestuarii TaxID=556325 RepID=A0A7W8TS71_9MICC|nr:FAD-dependent oxidoreductase [Neomicrococcus aestuarii]MBB5511967.1 sarcosine oxidase [Neomicrococcus aestuarii]
MADSSDYVVVGAGLAGAATAWNLASRGHEVTLLERTVPASHEGSSHGSARIFRYAYPDDFYTRAVIESRLLWDELEKVSGQALITRVGAVDYGSERRPEELARILERAGVDHELLNPSEARNRWPHIAVDTPALWHPGAGVIDAESAVNTMVDQAKIQGARVLTNWDVSEVQRSLNGYKLVSSSGESLEASNLIISAGGWLPALLDLLPLPAGFLGGLPAITVRQEQAYHFHYLDNQAPWPTFIHKSANMQTYGLPGGRDADFVGQKVAEYNGGRFISSAAEQTGQIDPENRLRVIDYVRKYLPGLNPEPYAETTCLFTNTPDENFIIDKTENITVLSPCSGHGAKFAPLIGEWAADLATGTRDIPVRFRPATAHTGAIESNF